MNTPGKTSCAAVHGLLFAPRARPIAGPAHDGRWQISIPLIERVSAHTRTIWRAFWSGEAARIWWEQNAPLWQPGRAYRVHLTRLRTHEVRGLASEIHADVVDIETVQG